MKGPPMTLSLQNRSPHVRPGRHRMTRPRRLHLLDVENLVAGRVSNQSVTTMWSQFVAAVDLRWDDLSTVSVSRRHAATTFFALPTDVHRVIGSDVHDGADVALIESVDVDWASRNFGRVVIGSGDHIFAPLARQLTENGLQVLQVTGIGYCSADLYRACTGHTTLRRQRRPATALQCA